MTIHLTLGPGLYSIIAFVVGLLLLVTDEPQGSFLPVFGWRSFVGLLLWLSIPFVWLGWWLAR